MTICLLNRCPPLAFMTHPTRHNVKVQPLAKARPSGSLPTLGAGRPGATHGLDGDPCTAGAPVLRGKCLRGQRQAPGACLPRSRAAAAPPGATFPREGAPAAVAGPPALRRGLWRRSRGPGMGLCTDLLWGMSQVKNCLELQPGALKELSLPGLGNFCFPVRQPGTRGGTAACSTAAVQSLVIRALWGGNLGCNCWAPASPLQRNAAAPIAAARPGVNHGQAWAVDSWKTPVSTCGDVIVALHSFSHAAAALRRNMRNGGAPW